MSFDTTFISSSQLLKKRRVTFFGLAILIILFIISVSCTIGCEWKELKIKSDLSSNWNEIFIKYLFLIVALERSFAVWVGITRGEGQRAWRNRIQRLKTLFERDKRDALTYEELERVYRREQKIISEIQSNDASTFLGNPDLPDDKKPTSKELLDRRVNELKSYLRVTLQIYDFKFAKYEEQSKVLLTRLVFFGGIVLAIAGISIFGDIIESKDINVCTRCFQTYLYQFIDVVITGGLIGGGSRAFTLFMNSLKEQIGKAKEPNQI